MRLLIAVLLMCLLTAPVFAKGRGRAPEPPQHHGNICEGGIPGCDN